MTAVKVRLQDIQQQIRVLCAEAGREPSDVTLVAVSKKHSAEAIEEAYGAGQRDFGESYVQEALEKQDLLQERCPDIRWHFIGRVQRNKAKLLTAMTLIHGVGSTGQLKAVAQRAEQHGVTCRVLLQVNQGQEEQKNGFAPSELRAVFDVAHALRGVAIDGLMTIPPVGQKADARHCFSGLRELRDSLEQTLGLSLPTLSMGMSADFQEAIREGATHIRLGTCVFGAWPSE